MADWRRVGGVACLLAVLVACGSDDDAEGTVASATVPETVGEPADAEPSVTGDLSCETAEASNDDDIEAVSQQLIEAVQMWDIDQICALVGREEMSDSLWDYHEAYTAGLDAAPELAGREDDDANRTSNLAYNIPTSAGGTVRLGFGWQRQDIGWVLLLSVLQPISDD